MPILGADPGDTIGEDDPGPVVNNNLAIGFGNTNLPSDDSSIDTQGQVRGSIYGYYRRLNSIGESNVNLPTDQSLGYYRNLDYYTDASHPDALTFPETDINIALFYKTTPDSDEFRDADSGK